MGWELAHLFSYQDGYGRQISSEPSLCDVCRVGDALPYTYDFGDDWQHQVTVEKAMARPTGTYPVPGRRQICLPAGRLRRAVGFTDMLRVLAGGRNARRRELVEWLDGPFDPKAFDMDEARERLAEYVEVSMPETQPA